MDVLNTDDRIGLYFRRRRLGLRLLAHGARPQTVLRWTGLTRSQLTTLRHSHFKIRLRGRARGPSPTSFSTFFTSKRVTKQTTLFAALCHLAGALTRQRGQEAAELLPNVTNGELLCDALERFRESRPDTTLNFEHASLLAVGIVADTAVRLTVCKQCSRALLLYLIQPFRPHCPECWRDLRKRRR